MVLTLAGSKNTDSKQLGVVEAAKGQPVHPPLAGLQILLVEDEPDMSSLFRFILEDAGAKVICDFWATTALHKLQQLQPDVLICDLRLPDADGLYLIRKVRDQEVATTLPAIATSSYNREFCAQQVLEAGFQAYLPKPCDPDGLITTIRLLTGV